MKGKVVIAVTIVLLVVGGLAGVKALQIKKLMEAGNADTQSPETISTVVSKNEKWQDTLTAIGSIAAVQGVIITPEISGTVKEIAFESGAIVKKGDLLVRLDTSTEEAQLRSAEAQVELSRINLERSGKLRADKTVSQSDLDASEAAFKQNQGTADTIKATIEKKTIRAPFAGRLGIRQANLGQYLENGKSIVSLQSLDPVYANFSLPQQDLSRLKTGMQVKLLTDAYVEQKFDGILTAINPDLDAATRSVGLQATFTNAQAFLRPGMFCRVEVILPGTQSVLVIPATAILSAPFGDSVFVVEPGTNKVPGKASMMVRQQFVQTGRTRGDFLVVESGLKPNQKIVSAGLFKLRNGMSVVENNNIVPKSEEYPVPADN